MQIRETPTRPISEFEFVDGWLWENRKVMVRGDRKRCFLRPLQGAGVYSRYRSTGFQRDRKLLGLLPASRIQGNAWQAAAELGRHEVGAAVPDKQDASHIECLGIYRCQLLTLRRSVSGFLN